MNRVQQAPPWKVFVGSCVYLLMVGPFLADAPLIVAPIFVGPVVAGLVIWGVVRWINRRDDPHFAKVPDEPSEI